MRIHSVIACVGLMPLLIAAAEPVRLQPSSPWIVDYGENSCRLIRTFGEGKTLTKFVLESAAPGQMDMLVMGKPLSTWQEQVPARFVPVGGQTFDGRVAETVTNHDPAILWSNPRMMPDSAFDEQTKTKQERLRNLVERPAPIDLAERRAHKMLREQFTAAVTGLEIQARHGRAVILETGSLAAPIKEWDKCGDDSLRDWGVDPALEERIVRPVWALNPLGWLYGSDYPADMLNRGKESEVAVRLLIDATGKVTRCTSLSHFAEKEFNQITCDLITKRARFAPAELADGTKVPSYMTRRVNFRIAH